MISGVIGPDDAKDIDIISNSVRIDENGKFHIIFRHPSRYVTPYPPSAID